MSQPLLTIRGLKTHFGTREGVIRAVDGIDIDVHAGKTLCIVGESGSGKSMMARSLLQIVPPPGRVTSGSMVLATPGRAPVDIASLDPAGKPIRAIRGADKQAIAAVRVFDRYQPKDGELSLAIEVVLQPEEHSFTEAEIAGIARKVVAAAEKLGAKLRG